MSDYKSRSSPQASSRPIIPERVGVTTRTRHTTATAPKSVSVISANSVNLK